MCVVCAGACFGCARVCPRSELRSELTPRRALGKTFCIQTHLLRSVFENPQMSAMLNQTNLETLLCKQRCTGKIETP